MRFRTPKHTLETLREHLKDTRWTPIEVYDRWHFATNNKTPPRRCLCQCVCGVRRAVDIGALVSGVSKGCGCNKGELLAKMARKYTVTNIPLYYRWQGMISRCYNPDDKDYHRYGGRGVRVCDEWRNNYQSFLNWALSNGYNPKLELDKDISGALLYGPDTCVWVTRKTNNNYKHNGIRIDFNGIKMTIKERCEAHGNFDNTFFKLVRDRIYRGWNIDDALSLPKLKTNRLYKRT